MTNEESNELHKVDEGTKSALAKWQADNEIHRKATHDQQEQPKKKKLWYDNVLDSVF